VLHPGSIPTQNATFSNPGKGNYILGLLDIFKQIDLLMQNYFFKFLLSSTVVLMTSVKAKINVGLNGREQFLIVPAANLPQIEI
jgi:hypothetical protein